MSPAGFYIESSTVGPEAYVESAVIAKTIVKMLQDHLEEEEEDGPGEDEGSLLHPAAEDANPTS